MVIPKEDDMNARELRAKQQPLKMQYREDPRTALATLHAKGRLHQDRVAVQIISDADGREVGLHPATGGDGSFVCSGDLVLEALAACAGVTLLAVATAMDIRIKDGTVRAEGDLDFRGTLGVAKDVPVGFKAIRLQFDLDTEAEDKQVATLMRLTERYCVVHQTLSHAPDLSVSGGRRKKGA
jgi:uncharacterized OsmC-like protein